MNQEAEPTKYWITSFSLDDALVVEAANSDEDARKVYVVNYDDLRYKYIDIEAETKEVVEQKKKMIDPRILTDPNTTVSTILSLPQMQGKAVDVERWVHRLETMKYIGRTDPAGVQQVVREYDRIQGLSDDELYQETHADLERKKNYVPRQRGTPSFAEMDAQAIHQMGECFRMRKSFPALDNALGYLYHAWEAVYHDREKVLYMRGESKKLDAEAIKRCSDFFDELFK